MPESAMALYEIRKKQEGGATMNNGTIKGKGTNVPPYPPTERRKKNQGKAPRLSKGVLCSSVKSQA